MIQFHREYPGNDSQPVLWVEAWVPPGGIPPYISYGLMLTRFNLTLYYQSLKVWALVAAVEKDWENKHGKEGPKDKIH